jgi:alpha-L-fucosidase
MRITGTFLDEISHDIPHQNWGPKEWRQDFAHMKRIGIDTVILIRGGYRKFLTYPSPYLIGQRGCYTPPVDLVKLFLELAEEQGMRFYFGLYDSGAYWDTGDMTPEIDVNRYVIDEVWQRYGHHKAFKGWYLSMEISRQTKGSVQAFNTLGKQCKDVSNGLPTFISPWIDGKKSVMASSSTLTKQDAISVEEHEKEWNEIFEAIHHNVDAVAFQDGHIDYDQLGAFFAVNKKLADRYGMECWTNAESFDRDMPIKFFPIKFEKLRLKLEAARKAGYDKAITFEFSHFMSPQSAYLQAGHLYDRYQEYISNL